MTMTLTIDGKDYDFKFGLRFVHKMNATEVTNSDGIKFAIGLQIALGKLLGNDDPDALEEILITANAVSGGPKVQKEDLEEYLEDLSESEFEEFNNMLVEELRHSNFTRKPMSKIKARLDRQEATENQQTKNPS